MEISMEKLLFLDEIRQTEQAVTKSEPTVSGCKADEFIEEWKKRFALKCKLNPHLALPTLHNVLGVILRDSKIHYGAEYTDLRTSLLVIQDSGAGKKPAMEFAESIVQGVLSKCAIARRSSLTSAGAVGTLIETKMKTYIPVYGDLKNIDYLVVSEAGSLLETKMDPYGNDLLRNICESQDTNNKISKKLAKGEIPPFTSKTVLSLWTVPPPNVSTLITRSGLIQRFIFVFKSVSLDEYEVLSDEILSSIGTKVDEKANVQPLIDTLKQKPIIDEFTFQEYTKHLILEKKKLFDEILVDAGEKFVKELKSFTVRRDLLMVKLAAQHAWLDQRNNVEPVDIEYAFEISEELWNNLLAFVENLWGTGKGENETNALYLLEVGKENALSEYYKTLMDKIKCKEALARRIVGRLEERGLIQRYGEKSNRIIVRLK